MWEELPMSRISAQQQAGKQWQKTGAGLLKHEYRLISILFPYMLCRHLEEKIYSNVISQECFEPVLNMEDKPFPKDNAYPSPVPITVKFKANPRKRWKCCCVNSNTEIWYRIFGILCWHFVPEYICSTLENRNKLGNARWKRSWKQY